MDTNGPKPFLMRNPEASQPRWPGGPCVNQSFAKMLARIRLSHRLFHFRGVISPVVFFVGGGPLSNLCSSRPYPS